MRILLDSLAVLTKEANLVFGILFAVLLAGGIIFFLFKTFLASRLTFSEYFSLSIAGALFALLLGISPIVLLSFLFKIKAEYLFFPLLIFVCGFMFFAGRNKARPIQRPGFSLLALILILIASVSIRLAFISKMIVPPYFDSAAHNLMINNLIASYQSSTIQGFVSIAGGYYHLGFHVLTAAFSLALHADVKDAMLVFGQIILALIPLPLFFIVKQETKSDVASLFAVLLAGFGWAMPAHAVNWGKYPALTSILAFEFTLTTAYLALRFPKRRRWIPTLICILSICISTFIHSRTLILTGIILFSSLAALGWRRLPKLVQTLVFLFLLGGLAALLINARSNPAISLALDPYLQGGLWISLAVLLLLPFACLEFPRTAFSGILSLLLLFGSLSVPLVNLLPGRAYQTLLDRPFVEIILFFPLSVLGGLGFAGLVRIFRKIKFLRRLPLKLMPGLAVFILSGLIFAHAFIRYNFYPADCCQIFKETDAVAFDWMDKNLPRDAGILIASSDTVFLNSSPRAVYAGSDAGIWLAPLINRKIFSMPYDKDLGKKSAWAALRRHGIAYIYVGGSAQSFPEAQLQNRLSLYKLVFSLPGAHVYELVPP